MRLLFTLAIFILYLSKQTTAQNTFNHRYHFDTPAAYLTSIVPTDSCFYATGIYADTSFGFLQVGSLFVKFDLEGVPVIIKKLVHEDKSYETRTHTLTALPDGAFVVTGLSFDPVMKGMLIKYNKEGDTLWTMDYLNPFYPAQEFMHPLAMARTPDGGFAIACWVQQSNYNSEIYLIRTDSMGLMDWGETFGEAARLDAPGSVISLEDESLIVGGGRSNLNAVNENYTFQSSVLQLSNDGSIEWEYLTPNSIGLRNTVNDMVRLEDGSLVIASDQGTEIDASSVNLIVFAKEVFKLGLGGQIVWEQVLDKQFYSVNPILTNIEALSDNSGYVVAGTSGADLPGLGSYSVQGWICKLSPEGDSIWARTYLGVESNNPRHAINDLRETPDGGFIICGESRDDDADSIRQQAWLLKLDQHGCLIPGCHLPNASAEPGMPEIALAIYPNPTTDYLNFQVHSSQPIQNGTIRIVDDLGRLMEDFDAPPTDATFIVPVWEWARGAYFLQYLKNGEIKHTEKFIKN